MNETSTFCMRKDIIYCLSLSVDSSNHNTRMAASGGYTLPKNNNDNGKGTFCYSGAQSWKTLPTHVRKSQNKNSFKTECVKYI